MFSTRPCCFSTQNLCKEENWSEAGIVVYGELRSKFALSSVRRDAGWQRREEVWLGINSLDGHLRGTADLRHAQYPNESKAM